MVQDEKKTAVQYYSKIRKSEVEWLWYPYIPYGKVSLLQGDPGDGKSSLVLSLAAILSTGGKLPDGESVGEAAPILYQCPEDSPSDTILPRLEKVGADCSKIAFIEDAENRLSLDDERIESAIRDTGARLVVFDPIQAFLQQDGEIQNVTRMRATMKLLADVAEQNHCAILLVGHMNKTTGGKNLYRGLGSIDIAAAARSVLMVTRDEDNPNIRYMFQVKSSLAPEAGAMSFYMHPEKGFSGLENVISIRKS